MLHLTLVRNVTNFPILIWQQWTKYWTKVVIHGNLVPTKVTPKGIMNRSTLLDWLQDTSKALSLTIPCVLDKPEVLAGVTEWPKLLLWEFDTLQLAILQDCYTSNKKLQKIGDHYFSMKLH